jgi:hypothetical protein
MRTAAWLTIYARPAGQVGGRDARRGAGDGRPAALQGRGRPGARQQPGQVRRTPCRPRSWANFSPFIALFPQECMGQADLHLLGQP